MSYRKIGPVLREVLRDRVIVTMKSGEAFDGVLYAADDRTWRLVNVTALRAGDQGENVPADGDLILPRDNIAFCQRP